MEANQTSTRSKKALVAVITMTLAMLFTLLVPAQEAEASSISNPCPNYSIQNVLDERTGNWDGDQVNNLDELYNGLNPCQVDTSDFCSSGSNSLCDYTFTYRNIRYVLRDDTDPCHFSAFNLPNDDFDRDGVVNSIEIARGTDPCISNTPVRVYVPVRTVTRVACPTYTAAHINAAPHFDWDGDGVTNLTEWNRGTNPCVFNAAVTFRTNTQVATTTTTTTTTVTRLPHVGQQSTYTPAPVHTAVATRRVPVTPTVCPHGYPYFHATNGQCYANPVTGYR